MTPATATPLHAPDCPWWQSLRTWVGLADAAFKSTPTQAWRLQVAPLVSWLHIIEAMLRRLILIAACELGLAAPTPGPARADHTRPASRDTRPHSFRIFSFRMPRRPARPRMIFLDAAPPASRPRFLRASPTHIATHSDALLAADNQFHATDWRPARARRTSARASLQSHLFACDGDPIPPYEHLAPPPYRGHTAPAAPLLSERPAAAPVAIDGLLARFLQLVDCVNAPARLIRRAALKLARLSRVRMFTLMQCAPPHPAGRLRPFTPHFRHRLIPAHHRVISAIGQRMNSS